MADTSGPNSVPLKASAALAEQLKQSILSRELPEGHRLPSERELCEQFKLSRTAVREALRSLELQGLITTKAGRGGGSVVRWRSADFVRQSIEMFIRGEQITLGAVIEVRELLEPIAARLAAERRTDDDLVQLGRFHAMMETSLSNSAAFLRANVDWHLAIARAGGNQLLAAFLTAISQPIHDGTDNTVFDTDEVRTMTIRAHEAIMNAVVLRDGDAAARRMMRHVSAYGSTVTDVALSSKRAPGRKTKKAKKAVSGRSPVEEKA
jgi:GntR family transcriptional repressor for pyruvate dehydrogenase complex